MPSRAPNTRARRGAAGICKVATIAAVAAALTSSGQAFAQARAPVRDPDNIIFPQGGCSWKEIRQRNIVMQGRDYSCGAAALATVMRYYWEDPVTEALVLTTLHNLLTDAELKDRIKNGLSIADMRRAAVKMGYLSEVGTLKFDELTKSKVPLIVPIAPDGYDHFVVYRGTFCGEVYLADPIRGNIRISVGEFLCEWKAGAVLVVSKPDRKPRTISPLTVRQNEVSLGWLNNQLIRTFPQQQITRPFP